MRKTKTTKLTCTPGRPSFPGNPISPFCRVHKHCPWINNNTACKFEKFHNIFLSLTEPNLISNWNGSLPLFLPLTTQLVVDPFPILPSSLLFQILSNPPTPTFTFTTLFVVLFPSLIGWLSHIWCLILPMILWIYTYPALVIYWGLTYDMFFLHYIEWIICLNKIFTLKSSHC